MFALVTLPPILLTTYAVCRIFIPTYDVVPGGIAVQGDFLVYILWGVISAVLFCLWLKLNSCLRLSMFVSLTMSSIAIYGTEAIVISSHQMASMRASAAEELGISFDTRTRMEVMEDLLDSGINASPYLFPGSRLVMATSIA